ncbi:MAG: Glycosyl transferase, group 2 family, partial [uncultured Phycisphaerae bacterium]
DGNRSHRDRPQRGRTPAPVPRVPGRPRVAGRVRRLGQHRRLPRPGPPDGRGGRRPRH